MPKEVTNKPPAGEKRKESSSAADAAAAAAEGGTTNMPKFEWDSFRERESKLMNECKLLCITYEAPLKAETVRQTKNRRLRLRNRIRRKKEYFKAKHHLPPPHVTNYGGNCNFQQFPPKPLLQQLRKQQARKQKAHITNYVGWVVQGGGNRSNTSPLEVSDDEGKTPTPSRKRKADVIKQSKRSQPPSEVKDKGQVDEDEQDSTVAEGSVEGGNNNESEKSPVRGGGDLKEDNEQDTSDMRQRKRLKGEVDVNANHEKEHDAIDVAATQVGEGGGSDTMGEDDDWGDNDQNVGGGDDGDVNSEGGQHSHVVPDEIVTAGDGAGNSEKDAEIRRLNAALEEAKIKEVNLNGQLEKMSDNLETVKSQSQADNEKLQSELSNLRGHRNSLSSRLDETRRLAATLEADLKRKEMEMKDAKNEVVTLEKRSKQKSDELEAVKVRSKFEQEQNCILRAAIEEKSQEIEGKTKEMEDLEAELHNTRIARLKECVDKKAAYAKWGEVTKNFEMFKSSWTRWGQEMRAKLTGTETRLEATSEAAAKLQVEVDKLKAEKGEMEARLQISTRNEEELRSRVEELELTNVTEKVEADESFWRFWQERKKLLARSKNKQSQLKAKVKQLKEENTSLRDQLEKQSREEIEVKEEELTDDEELKPLTSRLKERHTKKVIAEAEVKVANAKRDFAVSEVLRHQDKLDEANATIEEERTRRRQEMEEAEATEEKLHRKIEELRRTNERLRQKLPRSRRSSGSRSMGLNGGSLERLGP